MSFLGVGARLALVAAVATGTWLRLAHAPREPIWDGWRYNAQALALVEGRFETWNHQGFAALAAPFAAVDAARAAWLASLVAGIAGIVLAYKATAAVARREAAGGAAAWVVALFPIHVYWSGTGHAGTTAFALALASIWAVARGRAGLAVLAALVAATVRPDALALLPGLASWSLATGSARKLARALVIAAPAAFGLGAVFALGFGAHPGDFAWSVPPEHVPLEWEARARVHVDGSLSLDAASATLSPAYAMTNLAFYAGVLLRWSHWDWSGWTLYLPTAAAFSLAAAVGIAARRPLAALTAATALPALAFFSLYYGFSPEYVLVASAPLAVAAGVGIEQASRPEVRALNQKGIPRGGGGRNGGLSWI